ncbi:MAG: VWA domain-containing protein [bacterium]|nr:VWA domain-containing protein [bacterium]
MKKTILLIHILVLCALLPLNLSGQTEAKKQKKGKVVFSSPTPDLSWANKQTISFKPENISVDVVMVELYLDGMLLKEFPYPPYKLDHDFGANGANRTLKVVVRGAKHKVLARGRLKSYQVDDARAVEVNQVMVPVVVLDKKGNYVRGLKKSDFSLTSGGKPVKISYFNAEGATRFNMVQVIDISFSMREKLYDVLESAASFAEKLMTKSDRGAFVFFNHIVFDQSEFTGDVAALTKQLDLESPATGGTALLDALAHTLNLQNRTSGWNIMVVFSDGDDNGSYIDRHSLLQKMKKSSVVVYAIDNGGNRQDDILHQICELSGGRTFPLDDVKKTDKVYDRIRQDIRARYVLYFDVKKSSGKRFHELDVKVKGGYKVRTLKGHY